MKHIMKKRKDRLKNDKKGYERIIKVESNTQNQQTKEETTRRLGSGNDTRDCNKS